MLATGTATDPIGATTSSTLTVATGGATGITTIKGSFFKNRANWGNAITEDQHGPQSDPDVYVEATAQNLGFVAEVQCDSRTTGMRIYKMPASSGTFQAGCWNSAGSLLATKSIAVTTADEGWITVKFDSPVTLVEGETYYWGYNYPLTDSGWAWSSYSLNAQDNYTYPLWVPSYSVTGAGVKSGGSWRKAGGFAVSTLPVDRQPHNYFVDPLVEWDVDTPTYQSGTSYWNQFPNGVPRKAFQIGIYWADPPFIQQYADLGINTYWAGDVSAPYRDVIVAADMDWYPTLHGNDMSAPQTVQEDAALAAVVRGYMLTDEPELNTPFNSPATLRTWRNNCRKIDSTRPINLNLSRFTMQNQGFNAQPPGQTIKKYNEDAREYMSLADWGSLDAYGIANNEPYTFAPSNSQRYGIWWYPLQIKRMRDEITDQRIPISGVVETTSAYPNSPTPDQVKKTVWSMLIAGAKGIEYFDHRFAGPAVTQDFAAMLHGDPAMKNMVQALNAQMISLAPALMAPEANLITSYTSSGTMTRPRGGYAAGAKIPLHYSSRVVGGTTYFFVQAIREGTTTGTITIPGFQGATLTVIGESRTVTVNSSAVLTDTFTSDYAYHLYSTTATPTYTAPANTVAPVITTDSTPATGETVSVSTGTWTGIPAPTFSYQWKRNGTSISGATGSTYTLQVADEGAIILCTVTATNVAGGGSANSGGITPSAATGSAYASWVLGDSPAGYWRLKDYTDEIGSSDFTVGAGTWTDVASLIDDTVDGAKQSEFSGTGYLTTPDTAAIHHGSGDYSVETWIKLTTTGTFVIGWKIGDFKLITTGGKFQFSPLGQSGWYTDVLSATAWSVGTTYHVVGTWENSTKLAKIYVNGALDGTVDASSFGFTPTTSGWGPLILGYPGVGTGLAAGVLDEFAIYQHLLTPGQIAAHYAAGL